MIYQQVTNFQVLQRDENNMAYAIVDDKAEPYQVGGPYTIGNAHGVYVGDIWFLSGQSNMRGWGNFRDVPGASVAHTDSDPWVHSFQSCESWNVAKEPIHNLAQSTRRIHKLIRDPSNGGNDTPTRLPNSTDAWIPNKGADLGLTFAVKYRKEFNVPVGLVPCAHGGTSLKQWSPEYAEHGEDSLYNAMIDRFKIVGGRIAGLLWYQGESDAMDPQLASQYKDSMLKFIETVRLDLGNPQLPMIYSQIGRCVSSDPPAGWSIVRDAQRQIANGGIANLGMVSAMDTELDDFIHVSSSGLQMIGDRMFKIVRAWKSGVGPKNCPVLSKINVERVQFEYNPDAAGSTRTYLLLEFDNVEEWYNQRVFGFSIRDGIGNDLDLIHKVTFEQKSKIRLHLTALYKRHEGSRLHLWYGYGRNPICTVVDMNNMGLPAFGPIDFQLTFNDTRILY